MLTERVIMLSFRSLVASISNATRDASEAARRHMKTAEMRI